MKTKLSSLPSVIDPVSAAPLSEAGAREETPHTAENCPWQTQCGALREANQELKRLQTFTEAIVNAIPAGIALFDQELKLTYANAQFLQLFDCPEESVGKGLEELVPAEHYREWADRIRSVLDSGEPVTEHSLPHPTSEEEGTAVALRLTRLKPRKSADSPRVLAVVEDVSEQERLQHQLVVSEKLAAMGLLSAGIAHEIRTPLSVIRLAAFDVKDMLGDALPDAADQMDLIEKNVLQCDHIVDSLLKFARESPQMPRQLDLNQLLRDCLDIARRQIMVQDIVVERQFGQLPPVFAPEDDLKQVLSNIILNAVQAMPQGGYLTISSRHLGNGFVRIEVADTGTGIAPENLDRVFDPFFTTKDPGEGTGLGLSICRKIVTRLGGTITVQSAEGKGSTFRIEFPADTRGRR